MSESRLECFNDFELSILSHSLVRINLSFYGISSSKYTKHTEYIKGVKKLLDEFANEHERRNPKRAKILEDGFDNF